MRFNAGHALNYINVQPVAGLTGVRELHIGHAIVSRSVFVGLREAVRQMKALMRAGCTMSAAAGGRGPIVLGVEGLDADCRPIVRGLPHPLVGGVILFSAQLRSFGRSCAA